MHGIAISICLPDQHYCPFVLWRAIQKCYNYIWCYLLFQSLCLCAVHTPLVKWEHLNMFFVHKCQYLITEKCQNGITRPNTGNYVIYIHTNDFWLTHSHTTRCVPKIPSNTVAPETNPIQMN